MLVKMLKDSREGERNWVVEGIQFHCFQGKSNTSASLKLEMYWEISSKKDGQSNKTIIK